MSYSLAPWTAACQASLSITNFQSPPKPMSIELVMLSNHLILCCPLLLPLSFPASGYFQMSQLFATGGQSIGVSASASVLPMNIQDWFPLAWTGWISLQSKGLSRVFSNTTVWKHQSSVFNLLYGPTLTAIHDYWKNHSFVYMDLWGKVMSLLFNMLSRFVITFLPKSKHLLISNCSHHPQWFWSPRKDLSRLPLFPLLPVPSYIMS